MSETRSDRDALELDRQFARDEIERLRGQGTDHERPLFDRTADEPSTVAAQPRLVFFFSPTSGACRRVDAWLAAVLARGGNHARFKIVPVDVERQPALAERFDVTVVPTLAVVERGRVRGRVERPNGSSAIERMLADWLRR
jgi:thioredoxin-like negative regulator of GroEL